MGESTATRILPAETNIGAFHYQGTIGQHFTHAPINLAFPGHDLPLLQYLHNLGVGGEMLWHPYLGLADAFYLFTSDSRSPADHHPLSGLLRGRHHPAGVPARIGSVVMFCGVEFFLFPGFLENLVQVIVVFLQSLLGFFFA